MNELLQKKKNELQHEIEKIQEQENEEAEIQIKVDNYKRFKNRCVDWIIGRAHAQFNISDNGWHDPKGERAFPTSVSINGNCGKTYSSYAQITSSTNTYFHNVIPDAYLHEFQSKITDLTHELLKKMLGNSMCVLELMGLQSNYHMIEKFFTEEDRIKVKKEIEESQDEILNKFPLKELKALGGLSHGGSILARHLTERKEK